MRETKIQKCLNYTSALMIYGKLSDRSKIWRLSTDVSIHNSWLLPWLSVLLIKIQPSRMFSRDGFKTYPNILSICGVTNLVQIVKMVHWSDSSSSQSENLYKAELRLFHRLSGILIDFPEAISVISIRQSTEFIHDCWREFRNCLQWCDYIITKMQ